MTKPFKRLSRTRPRYPLSEPARFADPNNDPTPSLLEMGPPEGYDKRIFARDREIDRVVLAFALAANDLWDCNWVVHQIERGKPAEPFRSDCYDSGWYGLRLWISRVALSITNEVLRAIRENADLLRTDPDARGALAKLTDEGLSAWNNLVQLACDPRPEREFLERTRNNLGYHYHQPKALAAGYRRVFIEDEPNDYNRHAVASIGRTGLQTRFYFADAAAQGASVFTTEKLFGNASVERGSQAVSAAANALNRFVYAFMLHREESLRAGQD